MAESTVGSSTKGEVLVEFLDRPKKPAVKSVPLTGMASGRTDRGMRQGSGFKPPEVTPVGDYMGLAFDASVRKGKDAARAYLLAKMKRDGRSETIIQDQLKQFDLSIAKQQSLKSDQGLGEGMEKIYRNAAEKKQEITALQAQRRLRKEGGYGI